MGERRGEDISAGAGGIQKTRVKAEFGWNSEASPSLPHTLSVRPVLCG